MPSYGLFFLLEIGVEMCYTVVFAINIPGQVLLMG